MKKSALILAFLLVATVMMTGCKDPFFDGKFETYLRVYNKTNSTIVLEFEDIEYDTVYIKKIKPNKEGSTMLGVYEGSVKETRPSDDFINDKLRHVAIYRMVGGNVLQNLPREYYNEAGKIHSYVNPEFVIYEAFYELTVTEDMFYEKAEE
jgi:hypothetical protein